MTFIQPNRIVDRLTYILGACIAAFALTACWLIAMYVHVVDLEHDVASTKEHIQILEGSSASLRDKTYALLDANSFDALAADHNLVKDRDPQYVTIDQEWSLVSRF